MDLTKLHTMIEFMRFYPVKVPRDKNDSGRMKFVMRPGVKEQTDIAPVAQPPPRLSIVQAQSETEYAKHLTSLVLARLEDKHRSITEVFRFLD